MAKRYSRVVIYKKTGNSWAASGTLLDEARGVLVMRGIGKIRDVFEFKLLNAHNKYFKTGATVTPDEDDRIQIWMWSGTAWDSLTTTQKNNALEIDGIITSLTQDTAGGKDLLIKGAGFFDIIFKGLVFVRDKTLNKSHLIIQDIIIQLNKYNPNRTIVWDTDNDLSPKDINYTSSYKSSAEIIEELSSDKFTGDGAYKYYIKYVPDIADETSVTYKFVWKKKLDNVDNTLTEGTDTIFNTNLKKNKDKIINSIIYNVGFDCFDEAHEFLYNEPSQTVGSGGSWKYLTDTYTLIPDLIVAEFEADRTKWDTTTEGLRKSNFPSAGSYPYTFQFEERDEHGDKTGTSATATDDDSFNDAIVKEAEWLGRDVAAIWIDLYGQARWSGDVTVPFTNEFIEGNLLSLNSDSYNFSGKRIRIKDITNSIFLTTLRLDEDESTVGI